jgi:hypothetical protein
MMIKFKPGADILEDIPYIFLVPGSDPERNSLAIDSLKYFLNEKHGINHIGIQSPSQFDVEEHDFVVALKQSPKNDYFCALKVLFKSYFDFDLDNKLRVLSSLRNKYKFELFDGRSLEHLALNNSQLKAHLQEIQQLKKEEFLHDIIPAYSLN